MSFLLCLTGCLEVGYVVQAGMGQLRLWGQQRPISEVIDDVDTDGRTRALLAEVPRILRYAEQNGLPADGSYEKYVELDRPSVVWFMAASEPLAFEPKVWNFPIVGSFTYVGWFDYDESQRIERILAKQGWDVHVRRVRAYSTGGWFRDPILSTMLSDEDDAFRSLVNVLIHELVHANILVPDQSTFNESVASFVGDTMAEQYLIARLGVDSPEVDEYRSDLQEDRERGARMAKAYRQLDELYGGNLADAAKLRIKQSLLDTLARDLDLQYDPNNASLLGFKTYNAGLDEFRRLHDVCRGNWLSFFAALRTISASSFEGEQEENIDPIIAAVTAAARRGGCSPDTPS